MKGQPASSVTLVVNGTTLIGNIQANRKMYQIRYLGSGIHRLQEIDQTRIPAEAEPVTPVLHPDSSLDLCATDPPTDIDVLAIYTDDARVGAGGTDAIEATVYLALEETNQSYINSNITQRLRLAHVEEVSYAESSNSSTDLTAIESKTDGTLDNVHTLRDTYAADVVALITETLEGTICGRANIMATVSNAFEASAFAVIKRSCATGYYSFGHELGHNMGARHDWTVDNTNNSAYAFNHGYFVAAPADAATPPWRTIMGYNNGCVSAGTSCTRILYWSNPLIDYPVGGTTTDPMGTSTGSQQSDNHQTLETTDATVANFRCSSPSATNVWMKDTWNDTGKEPDPATAGDAMWESPYIWVRTSQDVGLTHQHEHQNPEFGSPNWVYLKMHNGAAAAASGNLELYYANASTSLTWPTGWTLIGTVPITNFAAHGTRVVEQQWPSLPGTGHYCLLARWVSTADPMTTAEGANIGANVRANNNLVWRNVNIVDLTSPDGTDEASFIAANPDRRRPMAISLEVGWRGDDRRPSFLPVGEVWLTLDDSLTAAWKRGGSRGTGFEPDQYGLRIGKELARLDSLVLPPGGQGRVSVRLHRPAATPRRSYWLQIVQRADKSVMGGVTYEIHTDRIP